MGIAVGGGAGLSIKKIRALVRRLYLASRTAVGWLRCSPYLLPARPTERHNHFCRLNLIEDPKIARYRAEAQPQPAYGLAVGGQHDRSGCRMRLQMRDQSTADGGQRHPHHLDERIPRFIWRLQ